MVLRVFMNHLPLPLHQERRRQSLEWVQKWHDFTHTHTCTHALLDAHTHAHTPTNSSHCAWLGICICPTTSLRHTWLWLRTAEGSAKDQKATSCAPLAAASSTVHTPCVAHCWHTIHTDMVGIHNTVDKMPSGKAYKGKYCHMYVYASSTCICTRPGCVQVTVHWLSRMSTAGEVLSLYTTYHPYHLVSLVSNTQTSWAWANYI